MSKYKYSLNTNDYINECMVSEFEQVRFIASNTPFERDDSLIGGDWKKVFYPLRKEYLENKEITSHKFPEMEIKKFYIGFENNRVEFSGFWHECHTLSYYSKFTLNSNSEKSYKFKLTTCGSVKIWIDGVESTEFSPYSRNVGSTKEIELDLKKGKNEIIVSCKDLAERDCNNFYSLQLIDNETLEVELPVEVDTEKVKYIEKLLKNSYLDKENYLSGDIKILFTEKNKTEFEYSIKHASTAISWDSPEGNDESNKRKMLINQDEITLGNSELLPIDFHQILLEVNLGDVVLKREYNVEVYPIKEELNANSDIKERKKQALAFFKKHGMTKMQKVFSFINNGTLEEKGKTILKGEIEKIKKRFDCSDFLMPALILLYRNYKDIFTKEELEEIKETILNYRYWMDEPGNDCMWFFSENHALCFHASEILAGETFKNEVFPNSGMTGNEHIKKAEELLNNWFDRFEKYGYIEWNSAVYLPIDLIGYFALYELVENKRIKARVKNALDKTFQLFAENNYKGIIASSHGRVYEKELRGRRSVEASALSWIAWGEGYLNQHVFATALFAVSSYEPPKEQQEIAVYSSPEAGEYKTIEGVDEVKLYMYKSCNYSMASALEYKPFTFGHQEHVFQANIGKYPESQIWINHPGENKINGMGRPSYFGGNGVLPKVSQDKDKAVLEFDILEKHEVDFTHCYCPLEYFDEYRKVEDWFFVKKDNGFIAIHAKNGLEVTKSGPLKNRELKSHGRKNIWTVQVGSTHEWNDFDNFIKNITK